jgi:phosphoserine phosphatase
MSLLKLPSWRPGPTREALEMFLDAAEMLPLEQRVAVFDIDGTLWCEKPRSVGLEFLIAELRTAVAERPGLGERSEYRAILEDDPQAIGQLGQVNVLLALSELHTGITPEAFDRRVRGFLDRWRHPLRAVPSSQLRYRPMLELVAELRARQFSVYLATDGGSEFVRVISRAYYGVEPEGVLGPQVGYELDRSDGTPLLRRTRERFGDPHEGAAKIATIQRLAGRRPILAAGNSGGDWEMLEYTVATDVPTLALLIEHDDAEREFAYGNAVDTPFGTEPLVTAARREGWSIVSMREDWSTLFADR